MELRGPSAGSTRTVTKVVEEWIHKSVLETQEMFATDPGLSVEMGTMSATGTA